MNLSRHFGDVHVTEICPVIVLKPRHESIQCSHTILVDTVCKFLSSAH